MSSKSTDLFKNLKLNAKKNHEDSLSVNAEEEVHNDLKEAKGTVSESLNLQDDENKADVTLTSPLKDKENTKVKETEVKKDTNASLDDNRANTGSARGLTPEIDGEKLCIKRSYQYRESTLRKLNELKAVHPDVNVYLNTIIDASINHYYDYIMNQGGKQK